MLAAGCGGDDDDATPSTTSTTSVGTFDDQAGAAFGPLAEHALELPHRMGQWLTGAITTDAFRADVHLALDGAEETETRVRALPDHAAKSLYLASATLYVQYERTLLAAIDLDAGPMRDQVVLLARRLRELGDRVFDRGHHLVEPGFGDDRPDVEINLPAEVPDWVAEGMAPGPPLAPAPAPPASTPPLREETRPTQPEADWQAAVRAAGAPDALDLDGDLAAQAQAYVDAATALGEQPDPDVEDGRERSAVLRLGWLIKADAARAAQAGLDEIAEALDQIVV